ncbi:MAG: hypothetical protein ABSB19_13235 [Methylomonas sp.]|jgi:hypothetical protein
MLRKLTRHTLLLLLCAATASAGPATVKPFVSGSYQQLLGSHQGRGFMLVIWSLDCSSCIKDMELLSSLHKKRPELGIVMLSTDEIGSTPDIEKLLEKYQLSELENWVFADDNTQKLRYEIDPGWYSELPRTYFYGADHHREGYSGALNAEDYNAKLAKLKI